MVSNGSDATIPYAFDVREIDEITLDESDDSDVGELWTHHYVADRPPAPYAESYIDEEVAPNEIGAVNTVEDGPATEQSDLSIEVKIIF